MELLKIYVNIIETHEFESENIAVKMILFDGYCSGRFFNGTILNGGVDTQLTGADGRTQLSARYMLQGLDSERKPCRLFIENNAKGGDGTTYTKPKIYTDSSDLKWMEEEALTGRIADENGQLVIIIESAG